MAPPVRAVTFDLWQTLMLDSKDQAHKRGSLRAERMHQILARASRDVPRETVDQVLQGIWQEWQTAYWDRNVDPGFDAQIVWLRERLDVAPDEHDLIGELRHAYIDPIFAVPPTLEPDAIPALTRLQARGVPLGLICNTSVTPGFALRRLLAGWGLQHLLPVQLYSDELHLRKPEAGVFHEAARQLGVDVAGLLHVGDSAEADVQGATGAGASALLVGPQTPLGQVVSTIQT